MNQYPSLIVKLSNSQHNELTFATKNSTEVVPILLSNMIGTNEINLLHNLLLDDR